MCSGPTARAAGSGAPCTPTGGGSGRVHRAEPGLPGAQSSQRALGNAQGRGERRHGPLHSRGRPRAGSRDWADWVPGLGGLGVSNIRRPDGGGRGGGRRSTARGALSGCRDLAHRMASSPPGSVLPSGCLSPHSPGSRSPGDPGRRASASGPAGRAVRGAAGECGPGWRGASALADSAATRTSHGLAGVGVGVGVGMGGGQSCWPRSA